MADFLEERISDLIRYGSSWQDEFAVEITHSSGGREDRRLIHPYPVRKFDISYMLDSATTYSDLLGIYYRAHGQFAGFRARCFDEWSSNSAKGALTAFDQIMPLVSTGVYQLAKTYGTDKTAGATGYATRLIKKPVSGTVRVGVQSTEIRSADWSVDTTTGRVTFAADVTASVSSIGQGATAVLTVGTHSFTGGMAVHISGVAGMTQINGLRALILSTDATHITVAINSSAFSAYTSGGTVHTRPQAGEQVTAGYEFDFPVRFNSTLPVSQDYPGYRPVDGVELIELLNP
ncbi:MAG: DUF2460 domain-containing protein [Azonexus sp.]|nr:DUF2460 domain-containing protein [Azonexus sp.]